jgi:hypothetical protein
MTDRVTRRHVEIKDGDSTVAAADVATPVASEGPARASLHATSGHVAPGSRTRLVDGVLDLRCTTADASRRPSRWVTASHSSVSASGATT